MPAAASQRRGSGRAPSSGGGAGTGRRGERSSPSAPAASAANKQQSGSANDQQQPTIDAPIYASDSFRMYAFKVLLCSNRQAHCWCAHRPSARARAFVQSWPCGLIAKGMRPPPPFGAALPLGPLRCRGTATAHCCSHLSPSSSLASCLAEALCRRPLGFAARRNCARAFAPRGGRPPWHGTARLARPRSLPHSPPLTPHPHTLHNVTIPHTHTHTQTHTYTGAAAPLPTRASTRAAARSTSTGERRRRRRRSAAGQGAHSCVTAALSCNSPVYMCI